MWQNACKHERMQIHTHTHKSCSQICCVCTHRWTHCLCTHAYANACMDTNTEFLNESPHKHFVMSGKWISNPCLNLAASGFNVLAWHSHTRTLHSCLLSPHCQGSMRLRHYQLYASRQSHQPNTKARHPHGRVNTVLHVKNHSYPLLHSLLLSRD